MAENHSRSKLKRKKTSVEDFQAETAARTALKRSHSESTAEPARSAWWDGAPLPAAEALWALTLRCALPRLDAPRRHLVPELPRPSARPCDRGASSPAPVQTPTPPRDGPQACDSKRVTPLPETSPPSPRTSPSPDALRLGFPQQDPPAQTRPGPPPPPPSQPPPHSQHRPRPGGPDLGGAPPPAGPSAVRREEGRRKGGGEQGGQTGPVTPQVWEDGEEGEEEVQGSVGPGGGGGGGAGGLLQSCPMCLLVFPVGFTQMDCDGHLAQCLSEVTVDVKW